jgi:uncharacterized protein YbbC (DUF1343 family)
MIAILTKGREKLDLLCESILPAINSSVFNGNILLFCKCIKNELAMSQSGIFPLSRKWIRRHGGWGLEIIIFLLLIVPAYTSPQVICGAERTSEYFPLIIHKNIAVVANPASRIGKVHLVDTLQRAGMDLTCIFSPEHGLRYFEEAGKTIADYRDTLTGIRVISLYGKKKKPDKEDLEDVDAVLFDLQDVGVRFFTYISTLTYVMEACAENRIPMILLDRPNPNGFYIDGPVLDSGYASFVGKHPVPVVYGMTIGEYAHMVNGEGWLKNGVICELHVVKLQNYTHQTLYTLPYPPSPNLRNMNAIYLYPSLGLFEGTIISVGRGTPSPFEVIGHPALKGFDFYFIPQSIKGVSINPPYKGQKCLGLDLHNFYTTHNRMFGRINLAWLMMTFMDLNSHQDFFNSLFDKLAGNMQLRDQIRHTIPEPEIRKSWEPGLAKFRETRGKYLLYP